jgi:DNA-binding transcriptional LysR family regulator
MDRLQGMATFRAVVEARGFARAAARIGMSAASVSRIVSDLEKHLDVRLLHRTTRTVSLTDEGQDFYDRCTRILDEVEEAEAVVRGAHETPTGVLRVATSPAFGALALGPLLPSFHSAFPAVRVDLYLEDRLVDVIGEGIDLALRFIVRRVDSSLVARRIMTVQSRFVASPVYLAKRGVPAHPRDLVHHAVITETTRSPLAEMTFDGPDGRTIVPVDGPFRTTNTMLQHTLVLAGVGITEVPGYVVAEELRTGALVEVLPEYRIPSFDLWAVMPPAATSAARVRAFVDHVVVGLTAGGATPAT